MPLRDATFPWGHIRAAWFSSGLFWEILCRTWLCVTGNSLVWSQSLFLLAVMRAKTLLVLTDPAGNSRLASSCRIHFVFSGDCWTLCTKNETPSLLLQILLFLQCFILGRKETSGCTQDSVQYKFYLFSSAINLVFHIVEFTLNKKSNVEEGKKCRTADRKF